MRSDLVLILTILSLSNSTQAQTPQSSKRQEPITTTVCEILEDPSSFNNKLVEVRGYITVNFEYSLLHSEACSGEIWFALADGSAAPGLAVTVSGRGTPGEKGPNGRRMPPIPVTLVRDANFEKFDGYLAESAKVQPGRPCGPDCHLYQVTATFIGRLDGVSQDVHAAHLKRGTNQPSHGKGFGQMGLFDAQLVVQSVKDVDALELLHTRKNQPKTQ